MSDLVAFVNGLSDPWAEAVWRACWQGAAAFGVVWSVCRAWPRLPASAQCWLWRLAYLKLMLGLVRLPALTLPMLPGRAAITVPSATASHLAPALSAGTAGAPSGLLTTSAALPTIASVALILWLLGAAWHASGIVGSRRMAQRLRWRCRPITDAALAQDLRDLCHLNQVCRTPVLMVGDIERPLLLGARRPAIILPAALLDCCGAAEVRLMLAHEVAHLRRRDLWWNWLPLLADWLFYFHPLVWLGRREWRLSQEMACDALAVQTTQRPRSEYGEMLVKVAARPRARRQEFVAVGIVESYQTLKRRLEAMAHLTPMTGRRWVVMTAVVVFAAAAVVIPWRLGARGPGNSQAALAAETGGGGGGRAQVPAETSGGGGGGGRHEGGAEGEGEAVRSGSGLMSKTFADLDPRQLRRYTIGRQVSSYPETEDLSTPERAYATINRAIARGDGSIWSRVSVRSTSVDPDSEVDPAKAAQYLGAEMQEALIYQGQRGAVIARMTYPDGRRRYDLRLLELRNGRWMNLGESMRKTIEEVRDEFARSALWRQLEAAATAEAMRNPGQFVAMAESLFRAIRTADYARFLASDPDTWPDFPADYMVATDHTGWVQWLCTTFSQNPILEVKLGAVFENAEGRPTVPYRLRLKDGRALVGDLPFYVDVLTGAASWQAGTGLDWHLHDKQQSQ